MLSSGSANRRTKDRLGKTTRNKTSFLLVFAQIDIDTFFKSPANIFSTKGGGGYAQVPQKKFGGGGGQFFLQKNL